MFLSKTKIFLFLLTIDYSASIPIPFGSCNNRWSCPIKQAVDTYQTQTTIDLYGLIKDWNTSLVTDMSELFVTDSTIFYTNNFNEDISKWDVSNVSSVEDMFNLATEFNADISKWDMSPTYVERMFLQASAFDQDISKWDFSKVSDTSNMFTKATAFNNRGKPLGLNTGPKLVSTRAMFAFATSFDQTLTMDTSGVVDMGYMFYETTAFTNGGVPLTIIMPVGANVEMMFTNSAYDPFNPPGGECPAGTYTSGLACEACEAGQYQDISGQGTCKACEAGQYQNTSGQNTCENCPGDTYSIVGSTQCVNQDELKKAYSGGCV